MVLLNMPSEQIGKYASVALALFGLGLFADTLEALGEVSFNDSLILL